MKVRAAVAHKAIASLYERLKRGLTIEVPEPLPSENVNAFAVSFAAP